jgi:hypothetical protein
MSDISVTVIDGPRKSDCLFMWLQRRRYAYLAGGFVTVEVSRVRRFRTLGLYLRIPLSELLGDNWRDLVAAALRRLRKALREGYAS